VRWLYRLPLQLKEQPFRTVLRAAFLASFVVIMPFMLFSGVSDYFADLELSSAVVNEQREMSQILSVASNRSDPESLFTDIFSSLSSHFYPGEIFDRRLQQIAEQYKNTLEFYIFDDNDRCLNVPGFPVPPRYVAQKFVESLRNPATTKRNERFLIQLSGYRLACKKIADSPGRIVSIGSSNDRHWGGFFPLTGSSGQETGSILVFVKKSGLDFDELMKNAVIEANAKFGRNYVFGLHDPLRPHEIFPERPEFNIDLIKTVNAIPAGGRDFVYAGRPGVRLANKNGLTFIGCSIRPVINSELYALTGMVLRVAAVCIWLILLPILMGITFWQPGLNFRISAVFLFGASIPLILLVFTGMADRIEREKVLINEYQLKNINELTRIDEGILFEYRRLESYFRNVAGQNSTLSNEKFVARMKNSGRELLGLSSSVRQILVVGEGWNRSFSREFPDGQNADRKETMALYGNMLLEVILGKYEQKNTVGGSSDLQSVVNNFGGWLSRGIILNSGRIGLLNVMDSVMPTYIDFFLDQTMRARAIMLLFLSRASLQRDYLFSVSKAWDTKFLRGTGRPAAFAMTRSPEWPAFPSRSFQQNDTAVRLAEEVMRSGIPSHAAEVIGPKKYLLTAMPGKNIDGYILFFAQPYEKIDQMVRQLNRRMVLLSLIILFIAGVAARVTSVFLLSPLNRLKDGLEAISCGRFRHQMPDAGVEEFSAMFGMLNQTLEGFQELQVARNLQNTLWPEKQLSGDTWHMFGRSITATELGGDHYDWARLKDGRILLMIGDVTGHGIAPSMVQASIKVWLSMCCDRGLSAAEILLEISRLHFNYGAKRLYMTCWLGLFSPDSGQIEFASAGHPYPILISSDGASRRLSVQGMPLGVRANARINSETIILASGESLILYTDGIVETISKNGIMLGFDHFEKICRQTVSLNAEESAGHIFNAAAAWGPQNDDQTLIILKRMPEQVSL